MKIVKSNQRFIEIADKYRGSPDFAYIDITNLHSKSRYGDELIHFVCVNGNVRDVTDLIYLGASVNVKGESGFTPLLYAVQQGHLNVVKILVEAGADIDAEDDNGYNWEDLLMEGDEQHLKIQDYLNNARKIQKKEKKGRP